MDGEGQDVFLLLLPKSAVIRGRMRIGRQREPSVLSTDRLWLVAKTTASPLTKERIFSHASSFNGSLD